MSHGHDHTMLNLKQVDRSLSHGARWVPNNKQHNTHSISPGLLTGNPTFLNEKFSLPHPSDRYVIKLLQNLRESVLKLFSTLHVDQIVVLCKKRIGFSNNIFMVYSNI